MRVLSLKRLREFWREHPDAERPLRQWYQVARHAQWQSLTDVRLDYPHADGVRFKGGNALTVFNIGGNKYRLIARIRFEYELVNVRTVLTHQEYGKEKWKR